MLTITLLDPDLDPKGYVNNYPPGPERIRQQLPSWTQIWTRKDMSTITLLDPDLEPK